MTSDVLPAEEFPQFASAPEAEYLDPVGPFIAIEGGLAAAASHADNSYMRLARTYDLSGVAAADAPRFEAQFSYATEEGYDHVLVEAHVVGQDDWTTLPEIGGRTTSGVPAECEVGLLMLKGFSHRELASLRGTTEATVRHQAQAIYQKSALPGRSAFCAYFLEDLLPSRGLDTSGLPRPTGE